ncbi:MAG: hypothetical protein NVSMB66_3120 [Candidatus Doudnabacteria bacterium]
MIRIKELFILTTDIYKRNFEVYLTLSIIGLVPFTAAGLLKNQNPLLYLLAAVVSLAIFVSAQLGIYFTAKHKDEFLGVRPAFIFGMKRIPSYLWISLLSGLIQVNGYVLFLIPGLLLTSWFAFASAVLVDENIFGTVALLKSKYYAKGHVLAILLRLIIVVVGGGLLSGLSTYLFGQLNLYAGMIFSAIMSILVLPFSTIYIFEMYRNLKLLKNSDEPFNPTNGKKIGLVVLAILGMLMIIGLSLLTIIFDSNRFNLRARIPISGTLRK